MSKLKIGFVLDDTLDSFDGVQQYILTLGNWFTSQGHEVHYLVGQTVRTDIVNVHSLARNMQVKFNGNRMSTPLPAKGKQIKKLLQAEKFDVLHVQIPYSPFMARKVIMSAPQTTAVIGTFHIAPNGWAVRLANYALKYFLGRSLSRFDALFSVSSAAAELAKKAYGLETAVLPNVVNTRSYAEALPISKKTAGPTIVFLGRLVERKGCGILLQALARLKDEPAFKDARTVICGKGPLRAELESFVDRHGLQDSVEFAGFVDEHAKARYLKTADIAVFPSTGGESFGIVLIEAMAARHPVVLGADNDGYRTVLSPFPGLLFPVNDPDALAAKLREYVSDASRKEQALVWQERHVGQFDVSLVGRRLVGRYQEVLRRKRNMR